MNKIHFFNKYLSIFWQVIFFGLLIWVILIKISWSFGYHYLWWFDRVDPSKLYAHWKSIDNNEVRKKFFDIFSCSIFVNHALQFEKDVNDYRWKDKTQRWIDDGASLRWWGDDTETEIRNSFYSLSAEWAGCIKKYEELYISPERRIEFYKQFEFDKE